MMPAHPAAETRWELATPHQSALAKEAPTQEAVQVDLVFAAPKVSAVA